MPTAAELQIIIETQDRASAQLRQIGAQVDRLSQTVSTANVSLGRVGVAAGAGAALGTAAMQGLQAATRLAGQAVGFLGDQLRASFQSNVLLEQATASFRVFTGSVEEAQAIVRDLQREADITPFDTEEIIRGGQALISQAHGSRDALLELLRVAEALAAFRPDQGLGGATFALREALEGDFQSIKERFGILGDDIQRLEAQGVPRLQAIRQAMEQLGASSALVQAFSRTFPGLISNVTSFANQVRQQLGAGLFLEAERALHSLNAVIDQFREELLALATQVGAIIAQLVTQLATQVAPVIISLLNILQPGLGTQVAQTWQRAAESFQHVAQAAQQAGPAVQAIESSTDRLAVINRELGQLGVAAAEIQLGADRLRQAYEAQIRPLERQLELLQDSADLQRVQAGLATNRATTERLRLEQQIAGLQRAAGGVEDPNAPGLTLRQRAIALALQERRLQLEQLGITEQQRPQVQAIQERLAQLRRDQADALQPSQDLLQSYRDRVDVLQIERQRVQNLQADMQSLADSAKDVGRQLTAGRPDPAEAAAQTDAFKQQGENVSKGFLTGFQEWMEKDAAGKWAAIAESFAKWAAGPGIQSYNAMGKLLGEALVTAIAAAVKAAWPQEWENIKKDLLTVISGPVRILQGGENVGQAVGQAVAAAGERGGVVIGDIIVGGEHGPGFADRLKQALTDFILQFIQSQGAADAGAGPGQQGAGRTP